MFRTTTLAFASIVVLATAHMGKADTVAYWEFDEGSLPAAAVGGATFTLTNNGYAGSPTSLVQPIPNPDTSAGFVGDSINNDGSVMANGGGSNSFIAAVNSRDALTLQGNAWTFEGWINVADVSRTLDPIFTTRGGQSGDGLLFDVRNEAGGQSFFNLFIDARGDDGSSATESVFSSELFDRDEIMHFALTFDSAAGSENGRFELFIDGESRATHDTMLNLASIDSGDTTQLELLGRAGDADGTFGGFADEFRISDTVLTPRQFLNAPVPEPTSVVLWLILGVGALGFAVRCRRGSVPTKKC